MAERKLIERMKEVRQEVEKWPSWMQNLNAPQTEIQRDNAPKESVSNTKKADSTSPNSGLYRGL